ncbi:hypothetical protein CYMTET_48327 [Cymbomonas tetramitiformis]|uniref:Uncharacterized protein n=1 Tax=Cymbomonas tetramitiformis TaxID=36881 RepID=A0AAE0BSG7_9CHLO|nr:hypothetical protein CYMTET_48327 [Cymbomonas tetramitiformis]
MGVAFFNDPYVVVSTPVELGKEEEFAENLSYALAYANDLITVLQADGFNKKHGYTLDTADAESDFAVLLAALGHILFPISYVEFSESLLDLENDHEYYHLTLNELLFTILPVVLRDIGRKCGRPSVIDEDSDPTPQLTRINTFAEGTRNYDGKAEGEWKGQHGAVVKRWVGKGYPCLLCFRMWALTDTHESTKGLCPYTCKEAYVDGRAPPTARPAVTRPPPTPSIHHLSQPAADPVVPPPPDSVVHPSSDSVVPAQPAAADPAPFMTLQVGEQRSHVGDPFDFPPPADEGPAETYDISTPAMHFANLPDDIEFPPFREPKLKWDIPSRPDDDMEARE